MLRLQGRKPTRENIRTYQAEKLGRFGGNKLLTDLMPIPKPKIKRWDYEESIPQFASREEYYRVVKPRRTDYLRALLAENSPKVVCCYGQACWSDFRKLFEGSVFVQEGQFQTAAWLLHEYLLCLMNVSRSERMTRARKTQQGLWIIEQLVDALKRPKIFGRLDIRTVKEANVLQQSRFPLLSRLESIYEHLSPNMSRSWLLHPMVQDSIKQGISHEIARTVSAILEVRLFTV